MGWEEGVGLLGVGLKSGVDTYLKAREQDDDRAYKRKLLALQMMKEGVSEGSDGLLSYTPEAQQKRELENDKLKAEAQRLRAGDPMANVLKQEKLNQIAHQKTPAGRFEKMGADVKQKIGFITGAMQNLTDYEDRFRKGDRQGFLRGNIPGAMTLMGSTPIDDARINMQESIGRLASGGAISKDELVTFQGMLPTSGDDDETAARKLLNLRRELENKLTAYGYKTDDLEGIGFDSKSRGYGTEYAAMDQRGLLSGKKGVGLIGGAQGTATAGNKVRVSNGKETLLIDPADAADAAKDGFQVVK